ncbi:alkaline phosphatase family protein [Streptomyces sp. NPDC050529]|uniref:alkaline phosphatase family protein n=1 Tax=unclassified Streptomyces TaxID=2593676 RepID=UPI002DDB69B8|nr:alkaline phosphatase family protein [Streptomyces sp. NBC_01022]WRZ79271.1 alkaline phosphatase family protein [Streptomyces sp. NBC_01022]WRZ86405.1 alkaline phosphatase family protein [Streptomyces sp. NBC_01022]
MTHPTPSRRSVLAAGAATAAAAAVTNLAAAPAAQAAPALPGGISKDKVLIIGMDGLRADRLEAADAPNLKSMMAKGTYAKSLLYTAPMAGTWSGPGWSTISTGVWPDKHGVTDNSFTGSRFDAYPGLLARLAQEKPGLSTYAAVDWVPLDTSGVITSGADAKLVLPQHDVPNDAKIAAEAEAIIRSRNPDVLFVYFGNVDQIGHTIGTGPEYMEAITQLDTHVGTLRTAIQARPAYASERWTVIVVTDHGHADAGGHGGSSWEERQTFILAQGPGIEAGLRPIDTRLVDVVPTVFKQLGLPVDSAWNLDGKPLQERSGDPFDSLQKKLEPRVDETGIPAGVLGYTHTAPHGWSVINSAMGTGGVTEWRGWTFTTNEFWSRSQRDQWRELNVRARGVFAVADSDEWSDKTFSGRFESTLVSPTYGSLSGRSEITITFMTHYRRADQQTAKVLVSFDAGPPQEIKSYASDVIAQQQSIQVPVPDGATSAHVRFQYTGDNDFYWVVDGFQLHAS